MTPAVRSVLLIVLLAISVSAGEPRRSISLGHRSLDIGGTVASAKALGDTIYLIGDPTNPDHVSDGGIGPQANGTFEDQYGIPGWFGWTSEDLTQPTGSYWNVSDFNAVNGNYSMWCGTYFDGDPGYGNLWNQNLVFTYQVLDNSVTTTVRLAATLQVDTEVDWDFVYVEYLMADAWSVASPGGYDGERTYFFDDTIMYQPGDFSGVNQNEIQLRIRFRSDQTWSDEDGLLDTDGACQVDDITVTVNGTVVDFEDFEDQVSDHWLPVLDPGVGDYAALYTNLQDLDDCASNHSAQVAFIDDGVIVPGTGGSPCTTWCYGPGGFIVNNTGGLMGPDFHLHNGIVSPLLVWPDGADAATIEADVYRHEEIGALNVWPGVFYTWYVRSTSDPATDPIEDQQWRGNNLYLYGGPQYIRLIEEIADFLEPGRTQLQITLRVLEWGYIWGWVGTDGTPAPYFDNVVCRAYPYAGPLIRGADRRLFQDNFPASGDLDYSNLAANAVRLDMAGNVASPMDLVNYPGDSVTVDVTAVRAGSSLLEMPRMYVRMRANPLFDGVRVVPPNFTLTAGYFTDQRSLVEGWVFGDSTYNAQGELVADRYSFDLPDEDFFFPGDRLHFYFEARDNVAGDIATSLLPTDTSGFAAVRPSLEYDRYAVRALPTMFSSAEGDQPSILYWCDTWSPDEWFVALGHLGFRLGVDYDMYYTRRPDGGVGNGLGGRATSAQLGGYDTLLYSGGFMYNFLLSNGNFSADPSKDLQVVSNWFARGDKNAFMTADNMVGALLDQGSEGAAFVNTYFNVSYLGKDIRDYIANQVTPIVSATADNGVIARVPEWYARGGCPYIRTFDAIEPVGGTSRVAEFTDPGGNAGIYPYAAAIHHHHAPENANVVMMPLDFANIGNVPGWVPPVGYVGISARAVILEDILNGFGEFSISDPIGIAPDNPLVVKSFPNPFNPSTTFELILAAPDDVSLKIFDLRGRLVRELVSGEIAAGRHEIRWDGRASQGNDVASGVYFYELRALGETRVGKMTLVR